MKVFCADGCSIILFLTKLLFLWNILPVNYFIIFAPFRLSLLNNDEPYRWYWKFFWHNFIGQIRDTEQMILAFMISRIFLVHHYCPDSSTLIKLKKSCTKQADECRSIIFPKIEDHYYPDDHLPGGYNFGGDHRLSWKYREKWRC